MFGQFDFSHPVSGKSERAVLDRQTRRWGGTDPTVTEMLNEKFPEGTDERARFLGAARELKAHTIRPDNGHAFNPTWAEPGEQRQAAAQAPAAETAPTAE